MATYKNWDDLVKGLQKSVDESLKTKVAPMVEKRLQKNAEEIAVGEWSRGSGGISDPKNIVSEVEDGELLTKDIAKFDDPYWGEYDSSKDPFGTAFAEAIDTGAWVDAKAFIDSGYQKPAPKRAARRFITETQEELNSQPRAVIRVLKEGMGIKE